MLDEHKSSLDSGTAKGEKFTGRLLTAENHGISGTRVGVVESVEIVIWGTRHSRASVTLGAPLLVRDAWFSKQGSLSLSHDSTLVSMVDNDVLSGYFRLQPNQRVVVPFGDANMPLRCSSRDGWLKLSFLRDLRVGTAVNAVFYPSGSPEVRKYIVWTVQISTIFNYCIRPS